MNRRDVLKAIPALTFLPLIAAKAAESIEDKFIKVEFCRRKVYINVGKEVLECSLIIPGDKRPQVFVGKRNNYPKGYIMLMGKIGDKEYKFCDYGHSYSTMKRLLKKYGNTRYLLWFTYNEYQLICALPKGN